MPDLNVSALLSAIQDLDKSRVFVVGDIMLDRFIYGHVDRISPESPVPVLSIQREDSMLGGAGNALANLSGLEAKGGIISLIGNDEEGKSVVSQLKALKCNHDLVVDKERPTIVKTRYLAGQQQLLRSDFEKKGSISDDSSRKIIGLVKKQLKNIDVLVLSDYGKGLLRDDVLQEIIQAARAAGVKVIVDPKGQDFSKYAGAYAVTPNKKELNEATGMPVDSDEQVTAAAQKIIQNCGIENVIATRSKDGISIIGKNQVPAHFPTVNVEVFDVSGAGDTVIATLAAALAAKTSLAQAATLANIAGSIVVQKVGTAKIRREEIAEALENDEILSAMGIRNDQGGGPRKQKALQTAEEALETIKRWRSKGLKIGFTNGCFDILHQGHVTYLAEARQHCDRLIVGLNKDSSVRILKGEERPVHHEEARATVLNALSSVNMVVLFGAERAGQDNTASKLLQILKPDIYFKGGDYTEDQIPETPTVKAYGGEVRVLSEVEGQSSTRSIEKMRKGGKAA